MDGIATSIPDSAQLNISLTCRCGRSGHESDPMTSHSYGPKYKLQVRTKAHL